MTPFAYARADDAAAAVSSGARHGSDRSRDPGTDFLAGGTDMIQLMREGLRNPDRVIDINGLPGLDRIDLRDDVLSLGALVRMSDAAADPAVARHFPVIAEALLASASAQVRNLATLGGNLLQRTRCGYFRDPGAPCNKREPGSGCPAIDGANRLNAILGVSDKCIATYAGDLANALIALDALVRVTGASGERTVPLHQLHREPGSTPEVETSLQSGELITAIEVPLHFASWRSHYLKVRDRASFEWALASAAVAVDLDEAVVRDIRICVGGVATVPWRLRAAESALRGKRLTTALIRLASATAGAGAVPRRHNAYKVELMQRTVIRALEEVGGLA